MLAIGDLFYLDIGCDSGWYIVTYIHDHGCDVIGIFSETTRFVGWASLGYIQEILSRRDLMNGHLGLPQSYLVRRYFELMEPTKLTGPINWIAEGF